MGQTLVMIAVHSYITWAREIRVVISHAPHGAKEPVDGAPGVRTTLLNEADARSLLKQLTAALEVAPECIDCGSTMHSTDDPACRVSHADKRDE